jgi:nitroimidazol reductase NimA-like FMN-containing flavoprotein (pyridoxamine 5'-phosphate oxidase superfamily)
MRRADRGQDDAWIRAFLHRAPMGVLATVANG